MTSTLDLCPAAVNICVTRGDTAPWTFTIKQSTGVPLDISGYNFLLTVDPDENPTSSTNNLFSLTGTVTNAAGGIVQFALTSLQANQTPGVYYFDVQMTDTASKIKTIAKGQFEIEQDITK
jgi:hypothetical protein